jgi:hypothetical protein
MGCSLGLSRASADLGKQEINTKGCFLVVEVALQLRDLLAKHVGSVSNAAEDADSASVCYSSCQLRAGGHVHAGKHDGVLDLEQIGELCADLLCGVVSM